MGVDFVFVKVNELNIELASKGSGIGITDHNPDGKIHPILYDPLDHW